MIELSALGSGKVLIDDHGITRERLLRGTQTIGWDEIETYHLTMEAGVEGGGLFDDLNPIGLLLDGSLSTGDAVWKYGIELRGGGKSVAFDWAFEAAIRVIADVLRRLHEPMMTATREQLRETGAIGAGELRIAAGELLWAGEPPLSLDEVEAIEFFNSSPVCVRVMKHGKVLPYAKCRLAEVGNVIEVLEVARELGYPVRGIELFDDLRSAGL